MTSGMNCIVKVNKKKEVSRKLSIEIYGEQTLFGKNYCPQPSTLLSRIAINPLFKQTGDTDTDDGGISHAQRAGPGSFVRAAMGTDVRNQSPPPLLQPRCWPKLADTAGHRLRACTRADDAQQYRLGAVRRI